MPDFVNYSVKTIDHIKQVSKSIIEMAGNVRLKPKPKIILTNWENS